MTRIDQGMAGYVTDKEVNEWKRSRHDYRPRKSGMTLSEIAWMAFVLVSALAFFYVGSWAAAIIDCGM